MWKNKFKKSRSLKDTDSAIAIIRLKAFLWSVSPLSVLGLIYGAAIGGIKGFFIGLPLGAIVGFIAYLLVIFLGNKSADFFAFIYGSRKANWNVKERLEGDLDQIRYQKMNKRFDRALVKVDEVLTIAPSHPEVLYLKASILWEGFNKSIEAKRCLSKVLKTTPKNDHYHRWASELYANIIGEEKRRLNDDHGH